jgi:hypothetical protein
MKFFKIFSSICFLALICLISGGVWGQAAIFNDDFNYSGNLTSNSWIAHSVGGTNSLSTTGGLTYAGHSGSNQGNSVLISNSGGEDLNKSFTNIATNGQSVYLSFLINVTDQATSKTGDYFIHLGSPGGAGWTSFYCRIFVRIVGGVVNFGLNNCSSSCTTTYGSTSFSKNTTYLVIAKYTITSGNDPISLWVFPSGLPSSEQLAGTPELIHNTTNSGSDAINSIGLRQGSPTTSVELKVDAINVGLTWLSVTPSCTTGSWIGSSTGNWSTALNWCGGAPSSSSNITIANGNTVTLDNTANETVVNDLTVNGNLILAANTRLTVNGVLTNNGSISIESGATLVQATNSSTITGAGTYQVKQALNASGRFWYLGVPLGTGSYTEQNFLDLLSAGDVLRKRTEGSPTWDIISGPGNNTTISAGKGFNLYINNTTPTLTFQGTGSSYAFNNGSITVPLTSSGSSYTGYNLVCNPYPSYVDWSLVSKTGLVDETIWYRIYANGAMTFGTINTGGISTTVGGVVVTKYLPPMQAFWVKAASGGGSLTFDNEDRTHFVSTNSSVAGLKNTGSNHVFIRMNVFQGEKTDQLIVYTDPQASPELDAYDSDKMMQLTLPQIYTKVGNQKTVINALHPSKKRQSIPVIMELPSTGVHHFEFEELEIGNGIIWLEDKQEEIMQALEPGTVYEFYANSGINLERFVLHFQLIDDATPVNVYNEVNSSANFSGKGASVHTEAAGVVVIKLPVTTEGITDIQIRDAAGKLVYTGSTNTLETSIQLAQANGIYYVTLNSSTGVEVRKVFIQQ